MYNHYNPFKENRAEQMVDLWKYYVPFPGLDSSGKPIIVEGGRGSGKTMFFQCNSWRQKLSSIKKSEEPANKLFEQDFIGIYYRVDTTFVSSMCDREETKWDSIFETYFSICIIQDILELLIELSKDMPVKDNEITKFAQHYSKRFNSKSSVDSLEEFQSETSRYLDIIENKINGIEQDDDVDLRWVNSNRIITDICKSFSKLFNISSDDILFKIFIDEYETLQLYQQKIINTLIKHSTIPVIFNIGLRPHGMKTTETTSQTEIIEAPHDYIMVPLKYESENYQEMLKEICKKRIILGKEKGKIPQEASEDIEEYLGNYSFNYELEYISSSTIKPPHKIKLKKKICEIANDKKIPSQTKQKYIKELCDDADLINSRLHYALLCKKTAYTPSLEDLYSAYKSNNTRYKDWMHNRKFGLLFLLCKENKKEKLYYGFEVFALISSNIVRYFLELCEQSFRIAFLNDYNWNGPISSIFQTEAAQYVSEYKVVDIAGYEPYGRELRIFVQYLGQIFYRLHTHELTTLGEPEPNHFSTEDLALSGEIRSLISSAIMWNVLQEGETTKKKQSKLSPETVDYYINKVYVPYFGISYRNQRKIHIDVDILKELLSGDDKQAKKAFKSFFKKSDDEEQIGNLMSQISLSDLGLGDEI